MVTVPELQRNSFFDDDDVNIKFEFSKIEKPPIKDYFISSKPIIFDYLYRKTQEANTPLYKEGYYGIIDRYIITYKGNSTKQVDSGLEFSNARLLRLNQVQGVIYQHGFSLQKNGNLYEFYSNNEKIINDWFQHLKQFCILTNFHDEYKAIKMIGKGSFAKVYLVESKRSGKSYAVKAFTKENVIISNKSNAKPSMINEIDIMRVINNENIIKLYDVYETEKSIYLILELIQGKSLQDILKKTNFRDENNENRAVSFIRMILEALAYLSSKNIMHRDLKPDNILVDKNDKIKIVDFGLATYVNVGEYIFKKCGTPGYIAPEVFKYDAKNPVTFYSEKCDVFSAGCILYYMLFGKSFFDGTNASEILKLNRKFTTEFESLKHIHEELKDPNTKINKEGLNLLSFLLEFDQYKRKSAYESLKHPFIVLNSQGSQKAYSIDSFSDPVAKGKSGQLFNDNRLPDGSPRNWKIPDLKTPDKLNPPQGNVKDKYAEKDSLYLDVGPPILNGKIDTLTQGMGSANNSLLLIQAGGGSGSNANVNSNSNSLSHFAKGTNADKKGKEAAIKYGNGGRNSILKAAIFRNMQKNSEYAEEFKEAMSPSMKTEPKIKIDNANRRFSEQYQSPINLKDQANKGQNAESSSSDSAENVDDISCENPQVQYNVEKMKSSTLNKHPSKMSSHKK